VTQLKQKQLKSKDKGKDASFCQILNTFSHHAFVGFPFISSFAAKFIAD